MCSYDIIIIMFSQNTYLSIFCKKGNTKYLIKNNIEHIIAYKIKHKKGTEKEQTRNNLHKLVSH